MGKLGARASFLIVIAASFVAACNTLLDFDQFEVGALGDGGTSNQPDVVTSDDGATDGGTEGGCVDPAGFGGRGCWRCAITTQQEMLNACTTAIFEPFDNAARIAGFDPSNRQPPLVDGGATPPPFDAGSTAPTDSGTAPVAPDCDFNLPNPVLVLGATGFPMDVIAKATASAAGNAAATIFYRERGSCNGVAGMVENTEKMSGEIVYFDSTTNGSARKCTIPAGSEMPADIYLTALFAESCANQAGLGANVQLPPGVQDLLGPVNPVMFAVPATSKERAVSAEAAYKIYGFGSQSGVEPWVDENYIFRRTASSGNQQTAARTLGLPLTIPRGRDSNGSSNMKNALVASDAPDKTIGISSSEIIDINRDVMKSLAYQHFEQTVAFYPDSAPGEYDRRNVRDGHYFMWIPLHVLVRTNAGDPVAGPNTILDTDATKKAAHDAATKTLAFVMVNRQEPPVKAVDLFGALKKIGNVPQCAMRVTRAKEGAPLTSFTPSTRCDCAFEAASPGTAGAGCTACTDSTTCPAERPTCSFGYCE